MREKQGVNKKDNLSENGMDKGNKKSTCETLQAMFEGMIVSQPVDKLKTQVKGYSVTMITERMLKKNKLGDVIAERPTRSTPFGILAPTLLYLSGLFRKSTISFRSSFSSCRPATSRKVNRLPDGCVSCARLLPKFIILLPPPPLPAFLPMSFPLTLNRLTLNLFTTIENLLIPYQLKLFGYSSSDALSIYGILTGMAFAIIMFPTVLTNSISV